MSETADQAARDTLAERYFGSAAGAGGPYALLGVTHECGTAADINRAVERRLAQLGRHRLALTPEADEVRLALYAAGAQLSDPGVHDACAKVWPPGEPHAMPAAWRTHLAAMSPVLVRRARHIIGVSGGWNGRAKKRLAMMARSQRVSALDLVKALRPAGSKPAAARSAGSAAVVEVREPRMSGRDWFLVHGLLSVMLLMMVSLIARELVVKPGGPEIVVAGGGTAATDGAGGLDALQPPERMDVQHHAALEQELRNAVRSGERDPADAGRRVARVTARFLAGWPAAPSDARARIVGLLTGFVREQRAEPAALHPVLAALTEGKRLDDPAAYAAATAIGDLLAPWLDAGDPVQAEFAGPVASADGRTAEPGEGFDAALLASLGSLGRIVFAPESDWWEAWGGCVERCAGVPAKRRETALLEALARSLRAEPVDDWRESARSLASRVVWRSGSPARAWLLERFDDPRARADRLSVLTRVLATEVSVPGIDLTMVLAPDANASDRSALARRYRAAWLAERAPPTEAESIALDAIKPAIDHAARSAGRAERTEQLTAIEGLVRANAAAGLLFGGDEDAPERLLSFSAESAPPGVAPGSNQVLDADWGVRLIRAETEQGVMRVLGEAGGRGVGTQAAEALVTTAFSGPGRRVRERAREMLRTRSGSIAVLLAMERAIGERPSSAEMALAADLLDWPADSAGAKDADAARTGLLLAAAERSVEGTAGAGLAGLRIQESLAQRAGLGSSSPPAISLAELVEKWSAGDGGVIERELGAMLGVSSSAGQIQAAYHRALVRLVGAALVERGDAGGAWAARILDRMDAEWAAGATATDQILASQLAEARLWELVLEGTP